MNTPLEMTESEQRRFWSKVQKTDNCWLWNSNKVRGGYGQFSFRRGKSYAHRISWETVHGLVPVGFELCHKCDVPSCVNPAHLFLGTHTQNMRDCVSKGRNVNQRGQKHGMAKLTDADVIEIRRRFETERVSKRTLSVEFGISDVMVGLIIRKVCWKHLP